MVWEPPAKLWVQVKSRSYFNASIPKCAFKQHWARAGLSKEGLLLQDTEKMATIKDGSTNLLIILWIQHRTSILLVGFICFLFGQLSRKKKNQTLKWLGFKEKKPSFCSIYFGSKKDWIYPHQDYSILDRESQPKPKFVTVAGWGVDRSKHGISSNVTWLDQPSQVSRLSVLWTDSIQSHEARRFFLEMLKLYTRQEQIIVKSNWIIPSCCFFFPGGGWTHVKQCYSQIGSSPRGLGRN